MIFFFTLIILILVGWLLLIVWFLFSDQEDPIMLFADVYFYIRSLREGSYSKHLELLWVGVPALLILLLMWLSLHLLFSIDKEFEVDVVVFVLGSQWYWTYSYSDFSFWGSFLIKFESWMVLNGKFLRLLEVDKSLFLPIKKNILLVVSASDVIHSWAVPELGVKVDAVPGRITSIMLTVDRSGSLYGQCSELCGVGHGFMPISIISLNL